MIVLILAGCAGTIIVAYAQDEVEAGVRAVIHLLQAAVYPVEQAVAGTRKWTREQTRRAVDALATDHWMGWKLIGAILCSVALLALVVSDYDVTRASLDAARVAKPTQIALGLVVAGLISGAALLDLVGVTKIFPLENLTNRGRIGLGLVALIFVAALMTISIALGIYRAQQMVAGGSVKTYLAVALPVLFVGTAVTSGWAIVHLLAVVVVVVFFVATVAFAFIELVVRGLLVGGIGFLDQLLHALVGVVAATGRMIWNTASAFKPLRLARISAPQRTNGELAEAIAENASVSAASVSTADLESESISDHRSDDENWFGIGRKSA